MDLLALERPPRRASHYYMQHLAHKKRSRSLDSWENEPGLPTPMLREHYITKAQVLGEVGRAAKRDAGREKRFGSVRDQLGRSHELAEPSAVTKSIIHGWPAGPLAGDVGDCQVWTAA